ncbi:UNVERIFIED_CONTAM: hypothetical protein BEN50_24460 [Euhalothece sp. KZN 001]|jgi:hypothetical protein
MDGGYRGVLGAHGFAFRRARSRLFRTYVIVGAMAVATIVVLIALGLVLLIARTASVPGGSLTLSRSFYIVIGVLLVLPAMAPILIVARRHRRRTPIAPHQERLLAVAGFLYLASVYLGVVASIPPQFRLDGAWVMRPAPDGVFAPVIGLLYAIPQPMAWVLPLGGAVVIGVVIRRTRRSHGH